MPVLHRTGQWCAGWRDGPTAAYDLPLAPEPGAAAGAGGVDRCFLLLDEGVQLTQPSRYAGTPIQGWWYVDLVAVDDTPDGLVVRDMFVDLLVPPAGDRFDVLDLDDLAQALRTGAVSTIECSTTLLDAQRFLDSYLKHPVLGPDQIRRDFPPALVHLLGSLPPFALTP